MNQSIRVLIADRDINFSRDLQSFLDKQENIRVIGIAQDGQGAVNSCKTELPDLVLMDLHLPVLDSIKAIEAIVAQNERIKIVGISSTPDDHYALEAIKSGARGYIEKNGESDRYHAILKAIRQVAEGEVILNPMLASSILEEFCRLTE